MEDAIMTCKLSEILMTGDIPIVINVERITSIRSVTVETENYVAIQMAEDQILTSYESPYICGLAIHSGEYPEE
jgi:hypothetical protein